MSKLSEDLSFRGLIQDESAGLRSALDGERSAAYVGFDPSGDSLHIGHLMGLCTLRRLQDAGHRPIALAGGGTGLIGDPHADGAERPLLTSEQHAANMAGIRGQLERLLDFSPERGAAQALLLDNADWLVNYRLTDFLREIGKHFTVNQMIAKESVRQRIERPEQGISFTEFSYMLLQACDYLHLHDEFGCKLQAGGSDQWGNITMGLELIRKVRHAEVHAFTWPLLLRSDGKKFGKSEGGAVWLDPNRSSPFAMYQYFVRVPDADVGIMLRQFTLLSHERIVELDAATKEHPEQREAQRELARAVTTFVHGAEEAERAERAAQALYSEEISELDEPLLLAVFADAPSSTRARSELDGGIELVTLLVESGLSPSRGAARTAIEQGGAYVNNTRRDDAAALVTRDDLIADRFVVLRRGKRDHHLLRFE
jgi:tyrosyl-tRNA synthetase